MRTKLYILLVVAAVLCACNSSSNNTPTTVSSDATVKSLTFASNSDYPSLSKTVFTIEDRIDTGLIYNIDSISYGTPIDSVVPSFRFNATPGAAVLYTPKDTIALTGSDTVDFSVRPMLLHVIASDYVSDKWYKVEVNVHQLDPDLYVWEQIQSSVYAAEGTEQQLIYHNGQLKWFVNDGVRTKMFESSNEGVSWTENAIIGLPTNCRVRGIASIGGYLYYCQDDAFYTSNDGKTWTARSYAAEAFTFVNLLCPFNDSIWSIVQRKSDEVYCFASSSDGDVWHLRGAIPNEFPISDYAAVHFKSVTGRERIMVVGGYTPSGKALNTRWNIEKSSSGEYHWVNFSIEQPSFRELAGVSIIWYNNRFFMFGGIDADNDFGESPMLESVDEGMHWNIPDSAHNQLPSSYQVRTKQSVVVDENNRIFIGGGQSRTETFSDFYRGRLNSINW